MSTGPTPPTPPAAALPGGTQSGSTESGGPAHPRAILAIVLVSYFMILLDNSIIFTGLPSIQAAFDLTPSGLAWVQDAYSLVFGGLLLLGARAGDLLGRRRVFFAGLAFFGAASLAVGLSPTGWFLIAARAVQGVGAAIVAPLSLSLLTASFPQGPLRSRAVAAYAAVAGIGGSVGLVVGGALTDQVSWRAGFLVNVPIAIAMMAAGRRYLLPTQRSSGRFDLTGALTATGGTALVVYGVIHAAQGGWSSPATFAPILAGGALLVVLVRNEAHAVQPILPLHLFASRERVGAYAARALFMGAMIGFFFFTTQYVQGVLGFTPLQAGLAFLPMTAVNFAVALVVSTAVRRFGGAVVLLVGLAISLSGMVWLSRVGVGDGYLLAVAAPMTLIGAGQGLIFAPLTASGLAGVSGRDAGAASGMVNTSHQLGTSLGLGLLVTIAATAGAGAQGRAALAEHVSAALSGGTVLLAAALVVVATLILPARTPTTTRTAPSPKSAGV